MLSNEHLLLFSAQMHTDGLISSGVRMYASTLGHLQDLILSRALALEATTSVLLDYTARRVYDRSPQIEVAYNDMPGVLPSLPHHRICPTACHVTCSACRHRHKHQI